MTGQIIYSVKGESDELKAAVASAQATFNFFWRELSWEARRIVKSLDMAAVKMSFVLDADDPDIPGVENMWVTDIEFDGESISGVLMNELRWFTSLKASDPVTLPLAALNDWMYVREGHVYGGFTVDALRSGMSTDDREAHDRAWGLNFGKAGSVEVVPAEEGRPPRLLSRNLDLPQDRKTLAALERTEHPMALNMRDKVEEGLQQHPEVIHELDAGGWLLLHREVLAGNYTVVRSLLRHGADPLTPNCNGQTSLALASVAGWQRIVDLLEGKDSDHVDPVKRKEIPGMPLGLALIAAALAWLYYLVIYPIRTAAAGLGSQIQGPLQFAAALLLLGCGLAAMGPWYSRLRLRTPRAGNSRVLDLMAMLGLWVLGYALYDCLGRYLVSLRY
ncbi:uncharacterized protein YegJ (DUF2314 family) [Pseudomonas graminis]|uniref:DUF2314 domain-containing protein n=1 Tax=Pseudomonas graminis TaxID=158627 RepID=UPI00105C49CB|nr:DUF2314 domain-containing protein [Pseudomonas graminis]TDV58184.1 uncharacterized protein YegJ (DUF2314 family) [Pseudomonas graminis]